MYNDIWWVRFPPRSTKLKERIMTILDQQWNNLLQAGIESILKDPSLRSARRLYLYECLIYLKQEYLEKYLAGHVCEEEIGKQLRREIKGTKKLIKEAEGHEVNCSPN
jgi:hypothetical protein